MGRNGGAKRPYDDQHGLVYKDEAFGVRKRMRIGLMGYGGWGRVHASAIGRVEGLSLGGVVAGDDALAERRAIPLRWP